MPVAPQRIHDSLLNVSDEHSFIRTLLIDTLEWEIPEKAEKVKDLGYEWYLKDDFNFDENDLRNLDGSEIFQIPVSRNQNLFGEATPGKWGVFIIPFKNATFLEKGRGLTSPLRTMLRQLVRKKADLPSFEHENILFICADPSFQSVTFARFKRIKGKSVLPLATFGWQAGDKNAIRTLCEHNLPNLHWQADWAKAFAIEPVTKAFYQEIFTWFETARPRIKLPLSNAVRILGRSEDDLQSEAVIRLVIRMIFIWFMKEKSGLVPELLFNKPEIEKYLRLPINDQNHSYYNTVLQNLFFATLNCPQDSRRFRRDHEINDSKRAENDRGISILYRFRDDMSDPDGLVRRLKSVPFLNGGLFTCHDNIQKFAFGQKRDSYHLDGFSENRSDRAIVPDNLFFAPDGRSGLIDILKRYHFTIEEHTPLEQDVALDPELLGHVFENLLAAYNPETKETARRITGSYYTPRNIVDYMVGESLYHYLLGAMNWRDNAQTPNDRKKDLQSLLDYEQDGNPFDKEESSRLRAALYRVRIFDPACGSGAFPMGALQRLNHVLERLNEEKSSHQRKLDLISQNIYGADIQPIATEITTQRFFISLLIDQDIDPEKPNSGVEPLPNLEVKFMTANTLLSLQWDTQMKSNRNTQDDLFYHAVAEQVDAIKSVFADYLKATTAKRKDELKGIFENQKKTMLENFISYNIPESDSRKFSAWEPFGFSKSAEFFDPQLMFGTVRPDPFDIVIGNPPYVRQEAIRHLKPELRKEFGDFFKGTADLYTYFYKKAVDLLKPGGVLAFITSNTFMSTAYGDKTRKLLLSEAFPLALIDFNEFPVFEAQVSTVVALIEKGAAGENATFWSLPEKELAKGQWTDPATAMRTHGFKQPVASLTPDKWLLEKPEILSLMNQLNRTATTLGEYVDDKIYYGVKTGLNEAFVIDQDTKEHLLQQDPRSAELIKPWLIGRNINKWKAVEHSLFLINIPSSSNKTWPWTRQKNAERIFAQTYPAIYQHLTHDKDLLEKIKTRSDQGDHWWELRSCAYIEAFSNPRIIYPEIANGIRFCWEEREIVSNNKTFIIPTNDKFFLAVLNSKVSAFWCWHSLPKLATGREFRKVFMQHLPIPAASPTQKADIANLATQILDLKSTLPDANISDLERQIDDHIYTLFNLTPADITLIEQATK